MEPVEQLMHKHPDDREIAVGKSRAQISEVRQQRNEERRQNRNDKSVDQGGHDQPFTAADLISDNARRAASEEMRDDPRNNDGILHLQQHDHRRQSSGEAKQETDHRRERRKFEQHRAIQRRNRARYDPVGNPFEGGYDFGQQHAHPCQNDVAAPGEPGRLYQGHDENMPSREHLFNPPGGDEQPGEEEEHEGKHRNDDHMILKKRAQLLQSLRLRRLRSLFEPGGDKPAQHIAQTVEMPHRKVVVSRYPPNIRLRDHGRKGHAQGQDDSSGNGNLPQRHRHGHEHSREERSHEQHMVSR